MTGNPVLEVSVDLTNREKQTDARTHFLPSASQSLIAGEPTQSSEFYLFPGKLSLACRFAFKLAAIWETLQSGLFDKCKRA